MGAGIDTPSPEIVKEILDHVVQLHGIDLCAYRPEAFHRRLAFRIRSLGLDDHAAYLRLIRDDPGEVEALVEALTIKVTCFFRNPLVFESLGSVVLPVLLRNCHDEVFRVWSAGCARGEEAYSLALLLRDLAAGEDGGQVRSFVLATDIDRKALAEAERAVYHVDAVREVKKRHLDAYFTPREGRYAVNHDIRSMVRFAQHDILSDRPPREGIFSQYHLILCRNVLIHFHRDVQRSVQQRLASMLVAGGCLVLGESEMLAEPGFAELLPQTKIYRKEIRLS